MTDRRTGSLRCPTSRQQSDADCLHCGLRGSALFTHLRPGDIEWALTRIGHRLLRRGNLIYRAGDRADALFTVRVGVVKLVVDVPEVGSRIVRLLGRGATLGLEGLATGTHAHTAIALRTTNLCEIPRQVINELHGRNPVVLQDLSAKWNQQMILADRWITILGAGPVKRRVADLVRLIAEISGDSREAVKLPATEDLAAILGITVESVSRHMAELKREGLLKRVAPRTFCCDPRLVEAGSPR